MICLSIPANVLHLILGDHVSVDMTPGPAPVSRALSAHHRDDEHATSFTTGATVGAQLSSPQRHLWNSFARPAHQGHKTPRRRAPGNLDGPTNSLDHGKDLCVTTWMLMTLWKLQQRRLVTVLLHQRPCPATGEFLWSVRPRDPPLHNDRNEDDLHELRLRIFRSFLHDATKMSFWCIPAMMPSVSGL